MRIAVASGKGGTGKTTVALGLALVSEHVTLVDCDVEEPDDHIFLDGPGELVEYGRRLKKLVEECKASLG